MVKDKHFLKTETKEKDDYKIALNGGKNLCLFAKFWKECRNWDCR
jgi:hypothetical protein